MHHKNLTATILALTAAFLLSACSKISSAEVDASSIYGEIEVKRTESDSYVDVDASFYVSGPTGTMVYLAAPAGVTINGMPVSETNDYITGRVHYLREVTASSGVAVVRYTDKNSREYTNSVTIPGITYASVPGTVSKAAGFNVSYSRAQSFASGDRVEVQLSGSGGGSHTSSAIVTGSSSGTHQVTSAELQSLAAGTLTVTVCSVRRPSVSMPYPKGLHVTSRSCANPVTVNLVP